MTQESSQNNFLTLRPKWNRRWEQIDDSRAVIFIPKFGEHVFGKWIMAKIQTPDYRLTLDEIGSFVWQNCNGMASVQEIAEKLQGRFGDKVEPVYERLELFFRQLEKSRSISWV